MDVNRCNTGRPLEGDAGVSTFARYTYARWQPMLGRLQWLPGLITPLLIVLIGVELAVLVAWLPDTVTMWWKADHPTDFSRFYEVAADLAPAGLYSPRRSLMLYPLTLLDLPNAYRALTTMSVLSLLAIAYLAQRGVSSWAGRLAIVLGVLAIPQMHWAMRIGHLTPILSLLALGGFLMHKKHPILAGLCFAMLSIKPQYAVVPIIYLLWSRNGRALVAFFVGVAVLELTAFAVVGFDTFGDYISQVVDWGVDSRDNRVAYKAWQYSWPGFLISAGLKPNPLVIFDLIALSFGIIVLVWMRANQSVAIVAAALGMLLIVPHANFYDWGLIVVAAVLLFRADIPWKGMAPVLVLGLYAALLASWASTNWPPAGGRYGVPSPTGEFIPAQYGDYSPALGLYWITPVALAVVCLLLFSARGNARGRVLMDAIGERAASARKALTSAPRPSVRYTAARLGLAGLLLPAAYLAGAYVGHTPPFVQEFDPFAPAAVLKEVPPDFPLPDDQDLQFAGEGTELPYHVEWTSDEPVSEVTSLYRGLSAQENWDLMLAGEEAGGAYSVRLAYIDDTGFMTHWVKLDVSPERDGSRITLDFFVTERISSTLGIAVEP